MIQYFLEIMDILRKSSEYRKNKYPHDNISSIEKARKYNLWYKKNLKTTALSMFTTAKQSRDIEAFKAKFHYWDEWSTSRYVREENPKFNTPSGKNILYYSVCRSCPMTGYYKELIESFEDSLT